MTALKFDMPPESVTAGEGFDLAVIVADDNGEQPEEDWTDDRAVKVTLSVKQKESEVEAEEVEISFWEALFVGVKVRPAAGEESVVLVAEAEGYDPVELKLSVESVAEDDTTDEDLLDIRLLAQRMEKAKGAKIKHFLMLIKGRLWGHEENRDRIKDSELMRIVIEKAKVCDSDETIEVIGVTQALLENPFGAMLPSCAACRSTIQAAQLAKAEVYATPTGITFHSGCLLCRGCQKTIGDTPFVRDEDLKPWHEECAKKGDVKLKDSEPLTCKLVEPPKQNDSLAPAVEDFLKEQLKGFCETIQFVNKDKYVRERYERMLSKIGSDIKEKFPDALKSLEGVVQGEVVEPPKPVEKPAEEKPKPTRPSSAPTSSIARRLREEVSAARVDDAADEELFAKAAKANDSDDQKVMDELVNRVKELKAALKKIGASAGGGDEGKAPSPPSGARPSGGRPSV